jgi:ATP-dependent protease ClpP protease subunit
MHSNSGQSTLMKLLAWFSIMGGRVLTVPLIFRARKLELVVSLSLILGSLVSLTGCERRVQHEILGSRASFAAPHAEILTQVEVDGLIIRKVESSCWLGEDWGQSNGHHLELSGYFGAGSEEILTKMLMGFKQCENDEGALEPISIFLNGGGGRVTDGMALGRLFRFHGVITALTFGQVCEASCAGVFLGGAYRYLWGDDSLLSFNAPFAARNEKAVECSGHEQSRVLKAYAAEMLPEKAAKELMASTLSYCDSREGMFLNYEEAKSLGLLTDWYEH